MADGTKIVVLGANTHEESGHISITVQSVTTRGNVTWKGPVKTYGFDANMFQQQFNGDIEQLKAYIKSQHTAFDGAHQDLKDAVGSLKGTEI